MRMTESKLRRIIRSVIRESIDLGELDSKVEKNISLLRDALKETYPPGKFPDFHKKVTDESIRDFLKIYFKRPTMRNKDKIDAADASRLFSNYLNKK